MRLLTAKGRGGLGKKSSFAYERTFRTEALELDEPMPSTLRNRPRHRSRSRSLTVTG